MTAFVASDMTDVALDFARTLRKSQLLACFRSSLAHHRWLLAAVVAYILATLAILEYLERPYQLFNRLYVLSALIPVICWAVFLLGAVVRTYLADGIITRQRLMDRLKENGFFCSRQVAYVAVPLPIVPTFSSAFSSFKSSISEIHPFSFDVALHKLDRWLHFGVDPWQLLHPILAFPTVTAFFNLLYNLWLPGVYVFLFVMIFRTSDLALRMRYLASFIALWVLAGSLMAVGMSSAGPCFFGAVTGLPDPYGSLLEYLEVADKAIPIWALDTQRYLWEAYSADRLAAGGGISAMPSMHVAIASLQAFAGWKLDRRLGAALTLYAFMILLGSVHLAWHYAVDAYVAMAVAAIVWVAIGRIIEGPSVDRVCVFIRRPKANRFYD